MKQIIMLMMMIFGLGACFSAPTTPVPSVPNKPTEKLPTVKEQEKKGIILFDMRKDKDVIRILVGKGLEPLFPVNAWKKKAALKLCAKKQSNMRKDPLFRGINVRLLGANKFQTSFMCVGDKVSPKDAYMMCKEMAKKLHGISKEGHVFGCKEKE